MFLYTVLTVPAAIIAGLLLALKTKKPENLVYGTLDRVGRITNTLLIPLYAIMAPFAMFLGMVSWPEQEGFFGLLGWIIAIVIASAPLFCGIGLGASVALRKKGKKIASFAVQFAGLLGIFLSFGLYALFVGTLISPLN